MIWKNTPENENRIYLGSYETHNDYNLLFFFSYKVQ